MNQANVSSEILFANLEFVKSFSPGDLCHALCRFICEVKKIDGTDYPPNIITELAIMIQMYLHENGVF